jgi:hypothetical protein
MNPLVPLSSAAPPALTATAGTPIATKLGNHSFRATAITAYLKNGGTLEKSRRDGEPILDAHDAAL